jgi:RNA polymerase sigma-70 factor (ECF subfamily)
VKEDFLQNITRNQGIIHKVTRIYCDNEDDRKDLFQEILIQLWKSYDKFREQSKFSTWMYRVAINTAITNFKKEAKTRKKGELGKELYQLAEETYDYEKEEHLNLLYEAINQLTGIEKSITLLFLEDKPYEEISEITGISQNYVRVKMNRIKKKLETYVKSRERK